ncbi:HIT family protein [Phanerochaete sordida]|uniref:HIT family protein n=1 Tax=Phanerochaete sordida TaxID=48140 RepID=A0A9P3GG98_9APHY|nr:HIT family protein [Phanerochaete sordida]
MAESDPNCIFCLIVAGKIPCMKVYETEKTLAFLDIGPVSEGHTQVIPKCHARTIMDMPNEYLADIGPVLKKVAQATGAEQFNVLQNNGKMAFQHVDHVHFHVIPKPNTEKGLLLSEDVWPRVEVPREELAETLKKMQSRL